MKNILVEERRKQAASLIMSYDQQMRQSFYKSSDAGSSKGFNQKMKMKMETSFSKSFTKFPDFSNSN